MISFVGFAAIFCCCIFLSIYQGNSYFLSPTVTNSSGDYYISSVDNWSGFTYGIIDCTSAIACHILCQHSHACIYLDATVSSNTAYLNIQCSDSYACQNAAVTVSNAAEYLNIQCSASYACYTMDVEISSATQINFVCNSDHSCYFAQVVVLVAADSVAIDCSASYACNYFDFGSHYLRLDGYANNNIDSLTLNCNGESACARTDVYSISTTENSLSCSGILACSYANFYMTYAEVVSIECLGGGSGSGSAAVTSYANAPCYESWFNFSQSVDVHFRAVGDYSSYGVELTGKSADTLAVFCDGIYACNSAVIVCPWGGGSGRCQIECRSDDYSCYSSLIKLPANNYATDLECYGLNSCDSAQFYCYSGISSSIYYNSSSSSSSNSSSGSGSWVCENSGCCPAGALNSGRLTTATVSNSSGNYYISSAYTGFRHGTIDCGGASACYILCVSYYSCHHLNVTVTNANTVYLSIKCSYSQSCESLNVNIAGVTEFEFHLVCNYDYACYYATIYSLGAQTHNYVNCAAYRACQRATMYLNNGEYVAISCGQTSAASGTLVNTYLNAACLETAFYALNVSNVSVSMPGQHAAYQAVFYFNGSIDVQFSAEGYSSLYASVLYAAQASNLHVTCSNLYACLSSIFHCPSVSSVAVSSGLTQYGACSVECSIITACRFVDIYIPNDNIYDELDLACIDDTRSCYESTLYCTEDDTYSSIYWDQNVTDWTCGDYCCPHALLAQSKNQNVNATVSNSSGNYYISSTNYEFQYGTIDCGAASACYIVCQDYYACQYLNVTAPNAAYLSIECSYTRACELLNVVNIESVAEFNLECNAYYSCASANVYSAGTGAGADESLTVTCNNDYACASATIYSSMATNNYVYCTAYRACYSANMYLNNGEYAAIICDHNHSSSSSSSTGSGSTAVDTYSEAPCYETAFWATNVSNNVSVLMSSSYAAYYAYFYLNGSNEVRFSADGNYASYASAFYAAQTFNLNVTCAGNYACYSNNLYCPSASGGGCSVECSDDYACYAVEISIPNDNMYDELDLDCGGESSSCEASTLYCTENDTYSLISWMIDNSTDEINTNGSWVCAEADGESDACCPDSVLGDSSSDETSVDEDTDTNTGQSAAVEHGGASFNVCLILVASMFFILF